VLRTIVDSVTITREGGSRTCRVQIVCSGGGTEEFEAPCTFCGPQ